MDGKNIVSQKFMNDKAIFADLFNRPPWKLKFFIKIDDGAKF